MIRPRRRRNRSLTIALWANAALLAILVIAVIGRGNLLGSSATAAPVLPPIAGGGGRFLMPAQFSISTWGCYVMDIDKETLCAYQFYPSEKQLRLVAARDFGNDLNLRDFNTTPHPDEIQKLIEMEKNAVREAPPAAGNGGNGPNAGGQGN